MYECSKCKVAVIVLNGKIIKPCKCEAAVTMKMEATAKGSSSFKMK